MPRTISEKKTTEVPSLSGTVLIIEDGPETQRLLRYLIEKTGLSVIVAENGLTGLKSAASQPLSLIIMDMQMPVMDGYTATRKIRLTDHKTPIIACSADSSEENITRCLEAGCNDIIFKPFDRQTLFSTLKNYCRTSSNPRSTTTDQELNSIRNDFITGLPDRLKNLDLAINKNDFLKISELAHSIAAAGMFGMAELRTLALKIEDCAKKEKIELIHDKYKEMIRLTAELL